MNLKGLPFPVFGDITFRGECPQESMEQITFFNRVRREHPLTWGLLALHPRNEGLKSAGQLQTVMRHKAEGMTPGAADVIIPGAPTFVCEIKRRDHTKSAWQDGQVEYLSVANAAGCFACVALGVDGAWGAFQEWLGRKA